MRAILLVAAVALAACGDDSTHGTTAGNDMSMCIPLTSGSSGCPACDPFAGASCGTEQEGFACQYQHDYCHCQGGRWACGSTPFPTADLALPLD